MQLCRTLLQVALERELVPLSIVQHVHPLAVFHAPRPLADIELSVVVEAAAVAVTEVVRPLSLIYVAVPVLLGRLIDPKAMSLPVHNAACTTCYKLEPTLISVTVVVADFLDYIAPLSQQ